MQLKALAVNHFGSGSTRSSIVWPSWILNLFVWIWIRILPSITTKNKEKPQFLLFCDFFYDFYLFMLMYLQKGMIMKIIFFLLLDGHWRKEQDPDTEPNLLVKGRVRIRMRIRIKMSRIWNTAHNSKKHRILDRNLYYVVYFCACVILFTGSISYRGCVLVQCTSYLW